MRPGPGLVVMALAFISGARRGSTSSINSKTTTTTSSPPLPPQPQPQILSTTTPLTSSLTLYHNIPTTTTYPTSSASALTFPSTSTSYVTGTSAATTTSTPFTGTSDLITSTSSSVTQQINKFYKNLDFYTSKLAREQLDEQHYSLHKRAEEPERFNFFNTFFIRNSYNSYPSASNYFIYTHPLPSHLRHFYEDKRARVLTKSVLHKHKRRRRRKRRTLSDNFDYKGSGTENLKEFDDTLTTAADNSSVDQTTLIRGLPVHFSPLTAADSSSTFDEDDIFALVAEDDLLSEESFDHLVKLTNDKIGDTNEEDYSSGTESVVESASSGSGSGSDSESDSVSGALDNLPDTSHGQNLIQHFVRTLQPPPTHAQDEQLQLQLQLHKQNEHSQLQDDVSDIAAVDVDVDVDLDDVGGNEQPNDNHGSEKNAVHAIYNAHLVGNSNEGVVLLTEADSTHSITPPNTNVQVEQKQITTTSSSIHTKKAELVISVNRYHTILKSSFALTRLNPWISACDLAQPGPISAPDLQGECLAGTLPVAWVAEGPGPPTCLKSCKEETPFTNKLNKDNMINYLFKNNSSINNNINNNNKKNKNKNDSKLNKLVGYTTTTNTFNIKLRNSQPTISDSINTNNNNNNNKNNKINNSKNIDTNKKNNNNNNNIIHKLLNPFNYYQINNSHKNNKMLKKRRNLKETSSAASNGVDIKLNTTMNMTPRYELEEAQSKTLSLHSTSEDYELMLHNMLMQQDGAAANQQIKRDTHQLKQQQQQQNLNNNVVKMKLTTAIYNDNNSQHNNQNKQIEMKYNFVRQDHAVNSNSNSDSRYQSNNINNSKKRFSISLSTTTTTATTIDNSPVAYNQYLKISTLDKTKEQQQQQQQKQQQQQCLEYLGDSDKTMPTHLCHLLTPSERLAQLRYLRLRNCCERNVYSTLHTLALNATLSGGAGCLSVLQDLMDLDALASRITCGLTEILFRFDCRQVYSIIHQCDDCKEAYRRWVCSTLVPYFAETNDIMKPPEILISTTESISASSSTKSDGVYSPSLSLKSHESSLNNNHSSNDTTMASNMTTSHTTAALPNNSNNNSFIINNNNNNNDTNTDTNKDMSSVMPLKTITSNFITNNNNNQNEMQYVANNYQKKFYLQQEQHHVKKRNIQQQPQHQQQLQPIINHKFINKKKNNITNDIKSHSKFNEFYYKTHLIHHENQPQQQQQHLQQQQLHTTSKAITFNDIVTPNSLTLSPRPSLHQKGNVNGTKLQSFGVHNLQQKSTNKRQKRSVNSTTTKTKYSNVVANEPSISSIPALSLSSTSALNYKQEQPQQQKQQQSFKFISTANNEDSFYEENPVITKLLKRTKRKEFEFRKRRRIRPCLSVCQTVEQKCPYLLPADRAPSMPTQYAGEPTFLCLDYNVAETDEQLKKASHGPNECCYTYCSTTANGICTYCDDMWDKTEIDKAAEILSEQRELKVFNITMKTKGQTENTATIRVESKIQQKMGETVKHVKMSTVAIVVRNDTAFENATRLAERLQYYAFCDGIFYYDDDSNDMPEYPHSESCRKLPPVQSRCSIPYYATNYISSADMLGSHRKNNEAQKLLLWLSTLLCLWSCYSARSMRLKRYNEGKTDQQPNNLIDISYKGLNKMCQKCQTPEIMQHKQHELSEKIFHFWYDYRESRAFIICLLKMKTSNKSEQIKKKCKSVREKDLLVRYLKQNLKSSSVKMNLNIFKIPTMIVLINYKEIFLLLLFKKRQKLRKRKAKCLAAAAAVATKTKKMFLLGIVRYASFNNLKSKAKKNSFNKNKIFYKLYYYYYCYYYYYYYYDYGYDYDYDYCSCSTIFSCSANENIIKNNNNYYYYKKKFIYNFSTCNFKYTNNNTEYRNINHNKIRIIEFNCKLISIIKFSTTKTTITATHIFIINYYNNNSNKNKNKINCFTIIIKKSYNNLECSNSYKKQQKIFKNVLISNPIHRHNHHHHNRHLNYYNNHHNYNGYYNRFIVKSQNMINNKFALPETCKFTCYTLTLMLTSTVTYENEFYNLLKSNMINNIIMLLMIIMMALEMLKIFIMPLLFKSFLKMTHNNINNNNNHHLNYNTIKFTPNFSPNTSYNSNYVIYCYFYYYNFNINDWWQRRHKWWRRRRRPFLQHVIDNTSYHYSTESLFQSGLKSQVQLYPKILL